MRISNAYLVKGRVGPIHGRDAEDICLIVPCEKFDQAAPLFAAKYPNAPVFHVSGSTPVLLPTIVHDVAQSATGETK